MIGKEKWNDSIRTQTKYKHPWNYTEISPYYPLWFQGFLGDTRGVWKDSQMCNNTLIRLTLHEQKNVRPSKIKNKNEDTENIAILEMNINQTI